MNRFGLIALFVFLSAPALAVFDGGSTGGGTTVNGIPVEDFAVDDTKTDLPDFGEVEKYLKLFDDRMPACGAELRRIAYPDPDDIHSTIWYLIPEKIASLPPEVTGFNFSTEQPAEQRGAEIYLSGKELGADTTQTRGEIYLHELLMMDHPTKNQEAVHRMIIFLRRKKFIPTEQELQNMLASLGFDCGKQPTTSQIAAAKKKEADAQAQDQALTDQLNGLVKTANEQVFADFVAGAQKACHSGADPDQRLRDVRERLKFSDYFYSVGADATKNLKDSPYRSVFVAQGDAYGAYMMNMLGREHLVSLAGALGLVDESTDKDGRLNVNCSDGITCLYVPVDSPPAKKMRQYQAKYKAMTSAQRAARACEDVDALAAPAGGDDATTGAEKTNAGSAE